MIMKETYKVSGSQATNIGWINLGNGDYRWYLKNEGDTRQRFMDKREMMMLLGQKVTSSDAALNGISGSEGYFAAIADRGINVSGGAMTALSDFDSLIKEFDKQGANSEYALYVNRDQDLAIDDMLASAGHTAAGGTTTGLAANFGAFNNDSDMAVELGFKSFTRGGYTFHKHDWKLLNDPQLLGDAKEFVGAAITDGNDFAQFNYRSEVCLVTRGANRHALITK